MHHPLNHVLDLIREPWSVLVLQHSLYGRDESSVLPNDKQLEETVDELVIANLPPFIFINAHEALYDLGEALLFQLAHSWVAQYFLEVDQIDKGSGCPYLIQCPCILDYC